MEIIKNFESLDLFIKQYDEVNSAIHHIMFDFFKIDGWIIKWSFDEGTIDVEWQKELKYSKYVHFPTAWLFLDDEKLRQEYNKKCEIEDIYRRQSEAEHLRRAQESYDEFLKTYKK